MLYYWGGVPFVIFAVGENTVGRDFALCAKHVGGQRWNRTTDTGIFNPLLLPTELSGHLSKRARIRPKAGL